MAGRDIVAMSREELRRVSLIRKVLDGEISQREAAGILELSDRQVRRLVVRVREGGDEGLAHRLRDRRSHKAIDERVKRRVLRLCRTRYEGFGPTLASEKLVQSRHSLLFPPLSQHRSLEGSLTGLEM